MAADGTLRGRRIGLSYETSTNLFYRDLADGVREAAAARGVSVVVRECEQSVERQRADIADLLAAGVDVLMISPVDAAQLAGALTAVHARGVPVFAVDRAVTDGPVVSLVTSDNLLGGRLAADLLAGLLGDQGDLAIVSLPTGGTAIADRVRGFKEALTHHGGRRVLAEVSGGSDRQRAREVTAAVLQAHPSLTGIFATNDVMVQGVLDAIRDVGREESMVVVGYDATPRGCGEIIRGGPLRGEVWTAGERVVFFPVRGYQMMLNEIYAASPDLVRHIVYRSGFVLGASIAAQVRELYPDPRDRLFVLLEDLARGGFGTFELLALDLEAGWAEVRGYDLFEAAIAPGLAWARTPRSVDNYCSGRLAGYLTAIFGRSVVCEEVFCQARGDPHCQFVITAHQ